MSNFRELIHGNSLKGWTIWPRGIQRYEKGSPEYENAWAHKGLWTVEDGVIV